MSKKTFPYSAWTAAVTSPAESWPVCHTALGFSTVPRWGRGHPDC